MKEFYNINATTVGEAVEILREYKNSARIIAGGTDLIAQMKDEILPDYPEVLVNIKTIQNLDYIKEEDGTLTIGSLTRLEDIAKDKTVKEKYTALAEAAGRAASPHIREMGTIGGNICQSNRCWYYWVPDNRFDCMRKGGKTCYAITGENRYHSIFGATKVVNPPCSSNCPASVDIPSYMAEIRDGNLLAAAKIIISYNPFPAITGRVCPHFCEQDCNRGNADEPLSIRSIERFIGDYILENPTGIVEPPEADSGKSVAIIGSGPAGLSAAYYLRKLGHQITIYDRMEEAGGLLAYAIPDYRLPRNVVRRQIEVLKNTGIEFKLNVDIGNDVEIEKLTNSVDALFLACGAWKDKIIGLQGEELTKFGLEFLTNVKTGNKEKIFGKRVLVIGGGSVAVDVGITALRLGAREVILACLESREEMPAFEWEIQQAVEEGVKLRPSWGPHRVIESDGNVSGIELVRCASVFDEDGHFAPSFNNDVKEQVEADLIIKAVGQTNDLSFIPIKWSSLINRGLIVADRETQRTEMPGVFAGGEIMTGPSTVIEAVATGRRAASAIDIYLKGIKQPTQKKEEEAIKSSLKFNNAYLKKTRRVQTPELSISEGTKSIEIEDVLGLSESEVEEEANRCFNCGCLAVNQSDIAPALIALNAKIITTKRDIEAERFFTAEVEKTTVLGDDEIVTEIKVPTPDAGTKSKFIKFALRKSIDFPIVSCASAIESEQGIVKAARICLNAVYNQPYRATEAEEFIIGKSIDESTAEDAGNVAISGQCPLAKNTYKVQIAKTLVKRTISACV